MKKITIITGASSGMGAEFASQLFNEYEFASDKKNAAQNREIWLIARSNEKLLQTAEKILSSKSPDSPAKTKIRTFSLDLTGTPGVYKFDGLLKSEAANEDFEVECLINNAGFGTYGPFEETSITRQMDMIELNCTSVTGICGAALPYLKKGSVIINTSSLAAFMPLGNFAVYGASKAYVLSFSIALAAELKDKGIKVCALCPGSVSTEFANVASNGARKEVKGGIKPSKVVAQCLKRAFKGKKISMYRTKWRCTAFLSRLVGRYLVARYTYKYNKRPHNPDEDTKVGGEVSISDFIQG